MTHQVGRWASLAAGVAGLAIAGGCGGCSVPTATPRLDRSTTTLPPTSSTTATPSGLNYEAAKAQWIGESAVDGGYLQNTALQLTVSDLQRGESTHTGDTSGYAAAIAAIKDYETLPDTDFTDADAVEARRDSAVILPFFGLTGSDQSLSGGNCNVSWPTAIAATKAWVTEPANTSSGIIVGPLQEAVTYLQQGLTTDSCDKSDYPAAIADLQNLESASSADIAASSGLVPSGAYVIHTLIGDEIAYLDEFFQQIDGTDSRWVLSDQDAGAG
jgi:hypothetical protein